ncbi:unnamed protein product [Vicia faba]|uniref:AB hydrolase-1 domain-containing protein n=1 Tax=Vicia faba TaxID=3906 RepID=A0AAV0YH22_VICFA|nr:unnamed protein product [Vicia faba]
MLSRITSILLIVILALAYKAIKPPPLRRCGSPGGPPITAPRIKLRDGRHLAYKEYGVSRELANKKIVFIHGFGSCRHDTVIATNLPSGLLEELGACIVSFDRAGYGESDADPKRSVKSLALDVEELADNLELGSKFYVVAPQNFPSHVFQRCLKFIPHRLAGATLLTPGINYWWHGLPYNMSTKAYHEKLSRDQWALRVAHYVPWLTYWWFTQNWFPTSSAVHFETWDFDPLDLHNPFPDNTTQVHLWQGADDLIVPAMLQRYIAQKLPWIQYHELPGAGHLFPFIEEVSVAIIKTQLMDTE